MFKSVSPGAACYNSLDNLKYIFAVTQCFLVIIRQIREDDWKRLIKPVGFIKFDGMGEY